MKRYFLGFIVFAGAMVCETSGHALSTGLKVSEAPVESVMMLLSSCIAGLVLWRRKKRFE